jgi:hypothetical protein
VATNGFFYSTQTAKEALQNSTISTLSKYLPLTHTSTVLDTMPQPVAVAVVEQPHFLPLLLLPSPVTMDKCLPLPPKEDVPRKVVLLLLLPP